MCGAFVSWLKSDSLDRFVPSREVEEEAGVGAWKLYGLKSKLPIEEYDDPDVERREVNEGETLSEVSGDTLAEGGGVGRESVLVDLVVRRFLLLDEESMFTAGFNYPISPAHIMTTPDPSRSQFSPNTSPRGNDKGVERRNLRS